MQLLKDEKAVEYLEKYIGKNVVITKLSSNKGKEHISHVMDGESFEGFFDLHERSNGFYVTVGMMNTSRVLQVKKGTPIKLYTLNSVYSIYYVI